MPCMVGDFHGAQDVTQSQESLLSPPQLVGLAGNDLVHLLISKGHGLPPWPSGSCNQSPQPWPSPDHSIPAAPSASLLPPPGHLQPHLKPLIRGGPGGSISLLCPPPDSKAQMFIHTPPPSIGPHSLPLSTGTLIPCCSHSQQSLFQRQMLA